METPKISLSAAAERGLVLSQLTENSAMLITMADIAYLMSCSYDSVQRTISKKPNFPQPIRNQLAHKRTLFRSGDVVRWLNLNSPRYR